jgi:hypothetical protein
VRPAGNTRVAAADAGSTPRVAVTAGNSIEAGHALSAPTAPLVGAPANTAPPTMSGTPTVGRTLTASTGTWTATRRASAISGSDDPAGANCAYIAGASTSTYAVTAQDAGSTLRVAVTATNPVGRATTVSAPTAAVT